MLPDISDSRAAFVGNLKKAGYVRTSAIEVAFLKVPRHLFLPTVSVGDAYTDRSHPVKIRDGVVISSSSQPAIMAEMLERLAPIRNERILEIGAGSGYNAALLAELVGPQGFVSTIDIDSDIVENARERLQTAGYPAVRVICNDGAIGDPENAPFDGIIVTVGVGDIPISCLLGESIAHWRTLSRAVVIGPRTSSRHLRARSGILN